MSDENENPSYCERIPQIRLVNFIMENSGQCFRKYQKDFFFLRQKEKLVKKCNKLVAACRLCLTSLWCVEDPLMLASVSIAVTRGSRASFSNFKVVTLIS